MVLHGELLLLLLLVLFLVLGCIITSNDDIQPSTVVSNQLPSGSVFFSHVNNIWVNLKTYSYVQRSLPE